MHRGSRLAVAPDPKLGLTALAEAASPDLALRLLRPDLHHGANPERRERRSIKHLGSLVLRYAEADMIEDHAHDACGLHRRINGRKQSCSISRPEYVRRCGDTGERPCLLPRLVRLVGPIPERGSLRSTWRWGIRPKCAEPPARRRFQCRL